MLKIDAAAAPFPVSIPCGFRALGAAYLFGTVNCLRVALQALFIRLVFLLFLFFVHIYFSHAMKNFSSIPGCTDIFAVTKQRI